MHLNLAENGTGLGFSASSREVPALPSSGCIYYFFFPPPTFLPTFCNQGRDLRTLKSIVKWMPEPADGIMQHKEERLSSLSHSNVAPSREEHAEMWTLPFPAASPAPPAGRAVGTHSSQLLLSLHLTTPGKSRLFQEGGEDIWAF